MTVNEFAVELLKLKKDFQNLPVVVRAENGQILPAQIKVQGGDIFKPNDAEHVLITY